MKSENFCHICPTKYLYGLNSTTEGSAFHRYRSHLVLAHLIEEDEKYTNFYNRSRIRDAEAKRRGIHTWDPMFRVTDPTYSAAINRSSTNTVIMDNSAFELYQSGEQMFDPDKLVAFGKDVNATHIVLPDYPGEVGRKSIEMAKKYAPVFRENRFKTFFVPQSQIGDLEDYIETFAWAAVSQNVDYIGVSIIGVPNAFSLYKNKLQRFLTRKKMMEILDERGLLKLAKMNGKQIHFLGMLDGPREIEYVAPFANYIDSWDSSAATWAGINDVLFDDTPTGLVNGKIETAVDFSIEFDESKRNNILTNMRYIDNLVKKYLEVK